MMIAQRFDVIEVGIAEPHHVRVLAVDKDKNSAEALIAMAIARRGVNRFFYSKVPAGKYKNGDVMSFFEGDDGSDCR